MSKITPEILREMKELIEKPSRTPTDEELETFCETLGYMRNKIFPETSRIIDNFFQKNSNEVLLVALFRLLSKQQPAFPIEVTVEDCAPGMGEFQVRN